MHLIGTELSVAVSLLQAGKLVAIPTETVYGLAANALLPGAVAAIFEAKKRPAFDPLIIHTDSLEKAALWTGTWPPLAERLAARFWPGALTLLLPKKPIIPDLVTAGLPSVGVRIPSHPLTLKLLAMLDFPLAAPSANPFGYISPTQPAHVAAQLGTQVAYILDGDACEVGIESTIIGFDTSGAPIVHRLGGIALEEIESFLGQKIAVQAHSSSNPQAPGMLLSHYAPRKPFVLGGGLEALLEKYAPKEIGALTFGNNWPQLPEENQCNLSADKNDREAAQYIFAMMRQLDQMPVKVIYAELLPAAGLGRAINDRLRRAAAQK